MSDAVVALLLDQLERVQQRTEARLAGLGDDEAWWEPVPEAWSVRPAAACAGMRMRGPDAAWDLDAVYPDPDPAPFTTIAWRLVHMADLLDLVTHQLTHDTASEAALPFADRLPPGMRRSAPHTAAGLVAYWHDGLAAVRVALARETYDTLQRGATAPWEQEATPVFRSVWLRAIDEQVHHAAEVGVLRDLYRVRDGLATGEDALTP